MPSKSSSANALRSATTRIDVASATAPSSGQVLTATGATAATWQTPSGGTPKMRISTLFETSARFDAIVSGGTNTFGNSGLSQNTTTTSSRYASVGLNSNNSQSLDVFAGSPTFSCNVFLNGTPGASTTAYFGIGLVTVSGAGHTYTTKHIGFKIVGTSLFATQANGTTETASSALLASLTNLDQLELICVVNGSSSVDYYYRYNGGALSSATNLTTNMPSGVTAYSMQFSVSNNATGAAMATQVQNASYER